MPKPSLGTSRPHSPGKRRFVSSRTAAVCRSRGETPVRALRARAVGGRQKSRVAADVEKAARVALRARKTGERVAFGGASVAANLDHPTAPRGVCRTSSRPGAAGPRKARHGFAGSRLSGPIAADPDRPLRPVHAAPGRGCRDAIQAAQATGHPRAPKPARGSPSSPTKKGGGEYRNRTGVHGFAIRFVSRSLLNIRYHNYMSSLYFHRKGEHT